MTHTTRYMIVTIGTMTTVLLTACDTRTSETSHMAKSASDSAVVMTRTINGAHRPEHDSTFFMDSIHALDTVVQLEKMAGTVQQMISGSPTPDAPYYLIQVGKMNDVRFEVFLTFHCDPATGRIRMYDAVQDTLIDMK